ncbi:MAG: hypothetical protein JJU06_01490 [Ectothiorhodospiraceae bacterium]|nr:hypothetical protein [Ectothiorhodospiraceae bacterium]
MTEHWQVRWDVSVGVALAGVALGMLALAMGLFWLGLTALIVIGLGLGFAGTLRHRFVVAVLLWLVAAALAVAGTLIGPTAFALTAPVIVSLILVALGQIVGVLAGVVSEPGAIGQAGPGAVRPMPGIGRATKVQRPKHF